MEYLYLLIGQPGLEPRTSAINLNTPAGTLTAPLFWSFFLLTGLSLFIFRFRRPSAARPFRVPLYPVVPLIFLLMSAWMLYRSILHAGTVVLLALVPLACGVPVYFTSRWIERRRAVRSADGRDGDL